MTLEEMIVDQRTDETRRRDYVRLAMIEEAVAERRSSLRSSAASALVRVGLWLDRAAGERAVVPEQQVSQ